MVAEAAEREGPLERESRGSWPPLSQLLWVALFLGYVTGVAAAIAFLPGPMVAPVIVPVAIAGLALGAGVGGWILASRWRRGVNGPRALSLPAGENVAGEPLEPFAADPAMMRGDELAAARPGSRQPVISADELRHLLFEGALDPFVREIAPLDSRPVEMLHAVPRLRQADGTLLLPARYRPTAARAGLRPLLDQVLVVRCAHLIAHALAEERDVVVFCDVAPSSVADPTFREGLGDFLDEHHHLATRLVLEFDRTRLERPAATALAELKRTGLRQGLKRFSTALHEDPSDLAARGFDFVKLELALPRIEAARNGSDRELFQLTTRLAEAGIDLVLERFDDERDLKAIPAPIPLVDLPQGDSLDPTPAS